MPRMAGGYTKTNPQAIGMQAHGRRTKKTDMGGKSRQLPSTRATLWATRRKDSGF